MPTTPAAPTAVTPSPASDQAPVEMAIPGMHALLMPIIAAARAPGPGVRALDVGAGQGALAQRLQRAGYEVSACDMFPELFRAPGIECRRVDAHGALPYADASFDLVTATELVEHLESHAGFFAEVARVLRPGGAFVFSTPNIVSLKSRFRFLFTGYFYSHGPLDPAVNDPVRQHIAAFTPDRYRFILARAGLDLREVRCDKRGSTSTVLGFLAPVIRAACRSKFGDTPGTRMQNCADALYGRTMVGVAVKR